MEIVVAKPFMVIFTLFLLCLTLYTLNWTKIHSELTGGNVISIAFFISLNLIAVIPHIN
jgi:hypothetical protein